MAYKLNNAIEIEKALAWLSKFWDRPTQPEYYQAKTVGEAVSLLSKKGKEARLIAGGVDIVGLIKNKVMSPRALIDINAISDMSYIKENAIGTAIGALTLISDIQRSDWIKIKYPILYEAAQSIASPQVRNMATLAGNLCQQVKCWYYRRPPVTGISFDCWRKREDGTCYAVGGENQYHAIFYGDKCLAVCPSDMATVLSALDARINVVNTSGARVIPLDEFYTARANLLEPNEVIRAIQIPEVSSGVKQKFLKFRMRKAIDFAIVSVATVITFSNHTVSNARLVLGGVSHKPYRAVPAEHLLMGERINGSLAEKVAEAAVSGARPLSKNGYKVAIAKALVKRVLVE